MNDLKQAPNSPPSLTIQTTPFSVMLTYFPASGEG